MFAMTMDEILKALIAGLNSGTAETSRTVSGGLTLRAHQFKRKANAENGVPAYEGWQIQLERVGVNPSPFEYNAIEASLKRLGYTVVSHGTSMSGTIHRNWMNVIDGRTTETK